jgi:hypothetical protein
MDARAQRIAENEGRFREINERLQSSLRALPDEGELIPFICECGVADCTESIRLSTGEYEGLRADALQFGVVPGHEITDVEDVVSTTDRYVVVRKHPETEPIARSTDPRAG